MAHGHRHAWRYPLVKLWNEAELVRERVNAQMATEALLTHSVIVAVLAPKGKGVAQLNKTIKKLQR